MGDPTASATRVSVVMTAYNQAEFIADALDSVLGQSWPPDQVVVIDDGSTDHTAKAVAPYRDHIEYHRQENRGVAAARNAGIRAANGEYLAFCDADDIQKPYRLACQAALLDRYQFSGLVCSDMYTYDEGHITTERTLHERNLGPGDEPLVACLTRSLRAPKTAADLHLPVPEEYQNRLVYRGKAPDSIARRHIAWAGASMYRRDAVVAAGMHDESLLAWEDWQLASVLAKTHRLIYLDVPVLLYRQHARQTTKRSDISAKGYRDVVYNVWKTDPAFKVEHPQLLRQMIHNAALRHAHYALRAGRHRVARRHLWDCIRAVPSDRRGYTGMLRAALASLTSGR